MKKRILSATFLILIAIPLIIAGDKVFALTVGLIGIFGLKEIIDLKKSHGNIPLFMSLLFYIGLLFIIYMSPFEFSNLIGVNYRLLSLFFLVALVPTLFFSDYKTSDAFYFLGMILFLGLACHTIIMIRAQSIYHLLFIILIPILTDSFAFLFGSLIGKHKMTPKISPNKSWEGAVLGSFCGTILASIFYYFMISSGNILQTFCFSFILSIVSQFGDLLFSKIKRENGVKDFSDLIPGHGGILDRFDSIIFVAIAFLLLIRFF